MHRVARRDPEAFRQLADKYTARSVRFVERLVGSRALAEDVVQDAFEAVWKQAPQWKPLAKFTTWLHQVLSNIVNRQFRDHLHDHETIDEAMAEGSPGTEEYLFQVEQSSAVKAALLSLPQRQRLAIVLFYYEELSQREACDVMRISEGALESLLSRGKTQLRAELSKKFMQ